MRMICKVSPLRGCPVVVVPVLPRPPDPLPGHAPEAAVVLVGAPEPGLRAPRPAAAGHLAVCQYCLLSPISRNINQAPLTQ